MSERVLLEIQNDIAIVSLNRPDKYNGLDMPMFESIAKVARRLKRDRSIRGIILRGEGKAFSSGLDVKTVSKNPLNFARLLLKPGLKASNLAQDVSYLWRQIPVPVVAVTHGFCFGGAFQIALGADFRYTTADCEFSIMEAKWGLIPDMGITTTLPELIPIDLAKELTMTARRFSGKEARAMGLVTRVCEDPMGEALMFLEEIRQRSPDAVAGAKMLYNNAWRADDRTGLTWETKLQRRIIGRHNQRAAVSRNTSDNPRPFRDRQDF